MPDMFAIAEDLAAHLKRDFDEYDTATAERALARATGRIQQATGQLIVQSTDTIALPGGTLSIWLPQRPVTAVGPVTTTAYNVTTTRTENTHYRVWQAKLDWLVGPAWPERVDVTYTHGYPAGAIPQIYVDACLNIAAVLMSNPEGLRSETVGAVSWTAAGAIPQDQIRAELDSLPREPVLA